MDLFFSIIKGFYEFSPVGAVAFYITSIFFGLFILITIHDIIVIIKEYLEEVLNG